MEWDLISYTPTWVVVSVGVMFIGLATFVFYSGLVIYRIQKKVKNAKENDEIVFTSFESLIPSPLGIYTRRMAGAR